MGFIKCKECGREISSRAKSCPGCGVAMPNKVEIVFGALIVSVILLVLLVQMFGGEQAPPPSGPAKKVAAPAPPKVAGEYSPRHKKVQERFRSKEEPTAKDALWTAPEVFKVGVPNDGGNRNGYADYVCQILYEEGFKGKRVYVQIIDIAKLQQQGEWEKLGEAHCQ